MAVNENMLEQAIIQELQEKGYEYVYGPDIERDYHEVILEETFYSSLLNVNPGITQDIISEAHKTIKNLGLLKLEDLNASFHKYLVEGIPVPYQKDGESRSFTVRLVDFKHPENNDFKVVNQFTIIEYKNKRPDILVFINGIPMVLFELKNMANDTTTVENAYKQIKNYQLDIPTLFNYNAFNVISDGIEPPYAPPIDLIPSKLYRLFKLAFNDSLRSPQKRPTAQEFYDVLNELSVESNSEKCKIAEHVFPKGMPSCPWCYVEDKMHLLTSRGALQDDFTYSSYTKLYKKSISTSQINASRKVEQDGRYPTDSINGDVSANLYTHQSVQRMSDTTVPPPVITSGRKTLSVVGCIGITLVTVIGCIVSYCISVPLIAIAMGILFAIFAITYLPRLSSDNAYKSIVEFPDYITVKCKEKKTVWYSVVPKVKAYFINSLALSVIISLCVATVLGFNKMILWSWSAFSLLSIFNTLYITEKRTLWTKTVLGIIIGVCCILTITLSVILFAQLLPKLFAF